MRFANPARDLADARRSRRVEPARRASAVAGLACLLLACGAGDDGADAGASSVAEISATEYAFAADAPLEIVVGDTVTFRVRNDGEIDHSLQVLDDAGSNQGKTGRIPPGGVDEVTITFDEAGQYRAICDIDDHFSRGQRADFTVLDAAT